MTSTQTAKLRPPMISEPILVGLTLLLLSFSLVMVYSTTGVVSQEKFGDAFYYVKRQGAAAVVGLLLMVLFSRMSIDRLRTLSPYLLGVSIALLVATYIPGIGDAAGGARRWIHLGFIRFQPGEFVKVSFVVFMAGFLARHEGKLSSFAYGVVRPFLLVGLIAGLFLAQPDFGSSVIVALVAICMTGAAGAKIRHLLLISVAFLIPAVLLVVISPYRMRRIISFLSPWSDPSGSGYQLIQSLIAVGTGKWIGVGLGASQQKLFFLPAAHTDFIFAVVAEELGFVGCMALLGVFLFFLWRGLRIAGRVADDTFAFSLAVGLTLLVVLPALLNTGVVTGLLPTKGMVLPLVGYGGSSVVACLIGVGLILSIARWYQRQKM